jgi:hypothetical protein
MGRFMVHKETGDPKTTEIDLLVYYEIKRCRKRYREIL